MEICCKFFFSCFEHYDRSAPPATKNKKTLYWSTTGTEHSYAVTPPSFITTKLLFSQLTSVDTGKPLKWWREKKWSSRRAPRNIDWHDHRYGSKPKGGRFQPSDSWHLNTNQMLWEDWHTTQGELIFSQQLHLSFLSCFFLYIFNSTENNSFLGGFLSVHWQDIYSVWT